MFALDTEYVATAYPVASAFNGATLYPLAQMKETKATYDYGDDGQRCEHIGFNLHMTDRERWGEDPIASADFSDTMYVNPKWTLHLEPNRPGGPTGHRFVSIMNTQGVNIQGVIMFCTVVFCQIILAGVSAVMIYSGVAVWSRFVQTTFFKVVAVKVGVNVADYTPNELDMERKNTGDDSDMALAERMANEDSESDEGNGSDVASEGGNSDEEQGSYYFRSRRRGGGGRKMTPQAAGGGSRYAFVL